MEALMSRIVAEGHGACNHMPKDRSYAGFDESTSAEGLRAALAVLAPCQFIQEAARDGRQQPAAATAEKWERNKWFRHPMGMVPLTKANVLD